MKTFVGATHASPVPRRRAIVRTYAGQPIAPIVERLRHGVRRPVAALQSAGNQSGDLSPHSIAGAKRLAILRAAMVDAGQVANEVLRGVTGQVFAASRVASGEIPISPALCDALVELCTVLARENLPEGDAA